MDRARDDPDLRAPRRRRAWTVRTDERRAGAVDHLDDRDHVEHRDPLGDAEDRPNPGVNGLEDGVGRARRRYEDARGVRAGLAHGFDHRVEYGHPAVDRPLPALARRHTGDDRSAVVDHRAAVEFALTTRDPGHDQPGVAVDQDAHAVTPRDAATALAAASSRLAAVSNCASRRSAPASAAFVPTIRTTIGTSRSWSPRASMRPRATSSPRVIPPKMLTRIALTFSSARMSLIPAATRSPRAPPPMSRKFADSAPARLTRSIVVIASPAPLTMQPMSPSSLMKLMPCSRASRSVGSSESRSRSASSSGCRASAESSIVTLASRHTSRSPGVPPASSSRTTASGLISTRSQSHSVIVLSSPRATWAAALQCGPKPIANTS